MPAIASIQEQIAWVPNASCVEALLRSAGFEVLSRPEHEFYVCRPAPVPKESSRDLAQLQAAIDNSTTAPSAH